MTDRYDHLREYYDDPSFNKEDPVRRVRWRSYDGQILRLQVLLEAICDRDHPVSILDVGCGTGVLYGLLKKTDRLGEYLGIDMLDDMVDRARKDYPEARFETADLLAYRSRDQFDLVLCSGTLNVLVDDHESWVKEMLKAMWVRARLAVAVNILTTRAYRYTPKARIESDLYHVESPRFLGWCEELTPWVSMRQDYFGSEASFYLYKEYHRSVRTLREDRRHDSRSQREQVNGLAYLLLERRLPEQALLVLDELEPDADVLNYKGMCYHRMGDKDQAKGFYEAALRLDPDHVEAQLNLAWFDRM